MAHENHHQSSFSYSVNNPILFTDPFGLDTMRAGSNQPAQQGDVVIFDKVGPATQSADEATVRGRAGGTIANVGMPLPGLWPPPFQPGPTPITLPRLAPLAIPIAYSALDSYLKSPTAVEDIAQLLERFGVDSELLRGPEILYTRPTPTKDADQFIRLPGNQGWVHKKTGEIYKKSHTSHGNPNNAGVQWKVWPKGTTDFGSNSKKSGQRTTLDSNGNIIGN